jgi:outer membrane protein OmpA-like peptidoglycan-associated protein
MLTRQRQPVVTGAWPSKDATKLTVSVGNKTYVAGAGDGLSTDGDNWTLRIGENLADGTYNVVATVTDQAGNSATDESDAELVVDATPPAVPTVNAYKAKHPRPLLSGTFPENDADTLAVTFAGETFAKGSSDLLSTDGRGNWSILTQKDYEPGTYDVKVVVADKAGNQRSDTTGGEVVIEAQPAPAPAPAPVEAAVNCQKLFDELLAGGKDVEFDTARATIHSNSNALLDALADVIKQCPDAKIEIGGHTDSRGSTSYNQALSERRALAVRDALIKRGATAGNLTAVGYGESRPIADNATKEGRARNRRTEFKVQP